MTETSRAALQGRAGTLYNHTPLLANTFLHSLCPWRPNNSATPVPSLQKLTSTQAQVYDTRPHLCCCSLSRSGEIGIRTRLKIWRPSRTCRFESDLRHITFLIKLKFKASVKTALRCLSGLYREMPALNNLPDPEQSMHNSYKPMQQQPQTACCPER